MNVLFSIILDVKLSTHKTFYENLFDKINSDKDDFCEKTINNHFALIILEKKCFCKQKKRKER